jgi:hypothetical protein
MSVINVMGWRIRLFYGVCTMTIICPFICPDRHIIVITVTLGTSGFIGFRAPVTVVTLMTVIYEPILKEALLPLSALSTGARRLRWRLRC